MISIRGLTKTYVTGYHALKGIDLEVRRGEILALLGPNGAGKTTMMTLLNPVLYLISGFRWSFYGTSDVSLELSLGMTCFFMVACIIAIGAILKTGHRIKH